VLTEYKEQLVVRLEAQRAKSAESMMSVQSATAPVQVDPKNPGKAAPAQPVTNTAPVKIIKLDDDQRMKYMTSFLEVMAKAAKFAMNSKSWLQLINIIMYTWNAFSYDLTNPLELSSLTTAWKSVVVIAECALYLLEYL